jgi:hypothetical protein
VICGFNTDVKYDSIVYHVQSEARQHELLLQTQVFVKGRCIGKHATSYAARTTEPDFSEEHMQDMLRDQHKHFVNAVREGRIEAELTPHEHAEDESKSAAAAFPSPASAEPAATHVAAAEIAAPPPVPTPSLPVLPVVAPPPIIEPSAPIEVEAAPIHVEPAAVAGKPPDPGLTLNAIGKVIGQGLSLECLPPAPVPDGITVGVRIGDESGPVADAQVSCRVSAGKAAGRYVYASTGADGVADLQINLNGLELAATALLIQASHRGKSTSRKFQLVRLEGPAS